MSVKLHKEAVYTAARHAFGDPRSVMKVSVRKTTPRSWTARMKCDDVLHAATGGSPTIALITLRIMIEKENVK